MIRKLFFASVFACLACSAVAQKIDEIINVKEVDRIERILSADDMQGRKPFTPGIEKAANFIEREFGKAGLKHFDTLHTYRQSFSMTRANLLSASGKINGKEVSADRIIAVTTEPEVAIDERSGYEKYFIDSSANLFATAMKLTGDQKKYIVFVNEAHRENFNRLKRLNRPGFENKPTVVFVLSNDNPGNFSFEIKHEVGHSQLGNIVGILPGKSKPNELVIFSAHYDHLGIGKANAAGDSIYNGANDDAAGTTAVIMLAKYFAALKNNERTLVFVAFTGEETGGNGSKYFSKQVDADKAVAMFNIEMIGTGSKWGSNSAYITGYEKSDFGKLLQDNLAGTAFTFYPDPYPKQNLFYRSDNATLAALGVPAHTISTSKMDDEKFYHTQDDEIETLDMDNMTEIIKAIAMSSKDIIAGKSTPARVQPMKQ